MDGTNVSNLRFFRDSLLKAVEFSKSTIKSISKPIYILTCKRFNIAGWSADDIKNYPDGWTQLKKDVTNNYCLETEEPEIVIENDSIYTDDDTCEIEDTEETKMGLVNSYRNFIKEHNYVPTSSTFYNYSGIDRRRGISISDLDTIYRENHPDEAKENIFDKKSWTPEYQEEFRNELKQHTKFIFTSVGSFCSVDWKFLKSLKQYAEVNDAMIIGIPLFKRYKKSSSDFCINPAITKYMWVTFEDIILNDNLMVQVLKSNCTAKSTLTGLNQLVAKYNSSIIVGGINQQLKYIPVLKNKTPNLVASTGCCTEYQPVNLDDAVRIPTKAEKLAKERLSIKGGLVVELGQDNTFTCRNIEADENGKFIDLAVEYNQGSAPTDIVNSTYIIGDLHAPKHNNILLDANIKAIEEYNCNQVVLHDSVNMAYVSHHNADKAIVRARMVEAGKANILSEIEVLSDILQDIAFIPSVKKIIIPYSNHPAHLEGFIQDISRMTKDDINLRTSLQVALAMLDDKNVLQYMVEEVLENKIDKVDWVPQDEGREVYGVQIGLHGSEKVNGGKLTATSTNNAFAKTVIAHRHSAGIDGNTITVGICCEKEQGYNHGLSSWTESSAIVYPNGKVQLLTFVNVKGDYKLWL